MGSTCATPPDARHRVGHDPRFAIATSSWATATSCCALIQLPAAIPWHEATALVLCDPSWSTVARRAVAPTDPGARSNGPERPVRAQGRLGARVLPPSRELRRGARERVHEAEPLLPVRDDAHLLAPGFDEPFIRQFRKGMRRPASRSRRPRPRPGRVSTRSVSPLRPGDRRPTITSSTSTARRRSPTSTAAR